ncbi:Acetolactate synthase isozymes, large subunit [Clostridium bornimense]|uniref:Acetolactate synthase n=1 Tax=Clostridium bornimense TaxID=1216932 RepID=W6RX89_9CLOT|nr:biosynthetic-type acetolactate synthase large subunit [Clostridium bornimense]CDM69013.1 Acetolactate synthase isozymes, large subunit [Clostridium bornimense]
MKYNGSEITIKLLELHGIEIIAGIPGGYILPLYDALYKSNIKHILARHEQGAAFMAQGVARSTGKPAVCFATSGPGATNLLTAIADAKLDSIPIIAITGQVSYDCIGTDSFQEVDTYGLTIPITKHNYIVHSVEELFTIIPEAFKLSMDGRPGPIVIDIPKDVQLAEMEVTTWPHIDLNYEQDYITENYQLQDIAEIINNSKKPIIYAGGGIINSNGSAALYNFAKKSNIPVALTLMGLGSFPTDDPLYLGMVGMHGNRYTNLLINKADVILAFGVRFDDRATGNIRKFCPNAKIVHVEIDEVEINKLRDTYYALVGDIRIVLEDLIHYINANPRTDWLNEVISYKEKYPFVLPPKEDIFHPINMIKYIHDIVPETTIVTTDVGQHQMWVAQSYSFNTPRTLLTSGGLGTMGFGLPAAIGAALANDDKNIICFSGDGSILMNIQELATLKDFNLNVKVIIFVNGHLGLVRQQQELFYNEHYMASKFISNPDFTIIGKGFGIETCDLGKENSPLEKLKEILSKKGPYVISIPINETENVYPMVAPGAANTEMIGGELNGN